ncbi:MAG: hypothetical protein ACREP7_07720 [Lysobacter sp.]
MVDLNLMIEKLQAVTLAAEIYTVSPPIIQGGVNILNVDGIKLFQKMFSIRYKDEAWVVSIPVGQGVDRYRVSSEHDAVEMVISYYKDQQFIE